MSDTIPTTETITVEIPANLAQLVIGNLEAVILEKHGRCNRLRHRARATDIPELAAQWRGEAARAVEAAEQLHEVVWNMRKAVEAHTRAVMARYPDGF